MRNSRYYNSKRDHLRDLPTLALPLPMRPRDLRQWLAPGTGAFLAPHETGFEGTGVALYTLCSDWINGILGEGEPPSIEGDTLCRAFLISEEVEREVLWVRAKDIRCVWPRMSAVTVPRNDGVALYVQRRSGGSYSRTFDTRAISVQIPSEAVPPPALAGVIRAESSMLRQLYPPAVYNLFCPEYPTDFFEAVSDIAAGALSVALTRKLILARGKDKDVLVLYRGTVEVGRLNRFGEWIDRPAPRVMRMLRRAFKKAGVPL